MSNAIRILKVSFYARPARIVEVKGWLPSTIFDETVCHIVNF